MELSLGLGHNPRLENEHLDIVVKVVSNMKMCRKFVVVWTMFGIMPML